MSVYQAVPFPPTLDLKHQAFIVPGSKVPGQTGVYREPNFSKEKIGGVYDVEVLSQIFESGYKASRDSPHLGYRALVSKNPPVYAKEYTWITYAQVDAARRAIGSGLEAMFKSGKLPWKDYQTVGIWSINRPEWQLIDLACQAYRKVSVSLYDTLGPDAVEYIINHAEIPIIFATEQHLSALLAVSPKTPTVKVIVSIDPLELSAKNILSAWGKERGIQIMDFTEFQAYGSANLQEPILAKPDDIASICYTSGTTSVPKGALLSNRNLASAALAVLYGNTLKKGDCVISYLPLAHIYERCTELFITAIGGKIGYYTGDPLRLLEDAQVLQPDLFASVPRVLNRIYMAALGASRAPGLKGALFRRALEVKLENLRTTGTRTHLLYDQLVFKKVQAVLGGKVKKMISGSAPISLECMDFLKVAFACDVHEGYGLTETCAVGTLTHVADPTATGSIGPPLPVNEMKLIDVPAMSYTSEDKPDPRGEICIRGPNVFKGYYKDPEKTKEAIDADGWFHTGDIASIDSVGRVRIIDRVKNIMKLAQGEYVAVEKVENVYNACPLIQQIYIHGDSLRDHLLAVVVPDPAVLSDIVKPLGIKLDPTDTAKIADAIKDPKIVKAALDTLTQTAKTHGLKGFETAKGVYLTLDPFTVENGLLTPTFKLKRREASQEYKSTLDKLFPFHSA